jgi:hypothetical protein
MSDAIHVLVGKDGNPTFLYAPYRITPQEFYELSPYQASVCHFSFLLLAKFLGVEIHQFASESQLKTALLLPILTQFLFVANFELQRLAAVTCIRSLRCITETQIQMLVSSDSQINSEISRLDQLSHSDKFFFAILADLLPDLFDDERRQILTQFLFDAAEMMDVIASAALCILLRGRNFNFHRGRVVPLVLRALLKGDCLNELEHHLLSVMAIDFDQTKSLVIELIRENNSAETVKWACGLWSDFAFRNNDTLGTLQIAEIGRKFPAHRKVTDEEMRRHAEKFANVEGNGCIYAIGTRSGCVCVMGKKHDHVVQIFDDAVDRISIGPDGKIVAAVSNRLKELAIVKLSRPVVGKAQLKVVKRQQVGVAGKNYGIVWAGSTSCSCVT